MDNLGEEMHAFLPASRTQLAHNSLLIS